MNIWLITTFFLISSSLFAKTHVILETTSGTIELELFDKKAPETVKNFTKYVTDKFYDGTIFHRVINGFMIQGGGYTDQLVKKSTRPSIPNEASNGVSNDVGTIAMARTSDPNSATAQFFINVGENTNLNFKSATPGNFGYAVFGRVVKGMTVVNKIKMVATKSNGPFQNLPVENVIITKALLKK
ncbi:MAG: peptidylprolyl isomerase [Bacteriovoracaceae bacterium]|nr:peptidylprolyl isomerase [Bacteriovoracaceae bacterium]